MFKLRDDIDIKFRKIEINTLGRVIEKKEESSLKPNYSFYSEKINQNSYALVLEIDIPGVKKIYKIDDADIFTKEGHYSFTAKFSLIESQEK